MKREVALLAAMALGAGAALSAAPAPKALVVMVDGLRADAVLNGGMPRVRSLMDGSWCPGYGSLWSLSGSTIRDAMTESAPNHVSIATGLSAARHGIQNNADLLHGRHTYGGVAGRQAQTWLSRLAAARPGTKPLFVFSWYGDLTLSPDYRVPFLYDRDGANAGHLASILSRADAPDAVMWYIDAPDHAGHGHGFQPYSPEYLAAVADADRWIGSVLDAISARPSFGDEDWLILVTSDHGGWRRYHGMMTAQAYTVPFIVAARWENSSQPVAGIPRTCDAAPTALAHFGLDVAAMKLDGKPVQGLEGAALPAPVAQDRAIPPPAAHFSFDTPAEARGAVKAHGVAPLAPELRGAAALVPEGGVSGGFLRVSSSTNAPGCALLPGTETLAFENGREFSFAIWVRTFGPQVGDPPALSNKDWNNGANPGIALVSSRATDLSKTSGCTEEERRTGAPGFAINVGRSVSRPDGNTGRQDTGTYDSPPGEWVFYAASCGADGILRFYQGHPDGTLYFISDDASACVPASGLPFFVGQDGTGRYRHHFVGDIDELSIWTNALTHAEIRALFEARNQR